MNFENLPSRILKKLSHHAFKLLGFDSICLTRITKQNDLKMIGSNYGGWVIPVSLLDKNSICYCVGCGEDISFDLGVIELIGCDVYGFDPTPRAVAHVNQVAGKNPKYHFFDVGLWDKEDTLKFFVPKDPSHVSHSLLNLQKTEDFISVKVRRLSQIMSELGHDHIDLLKIDIEGAEYKVIESILEDKIEIKIICVEYDECFNPLDAFYKDRIRSSVSGLLRHGYSLSHSQQNGNYTFTKNP